MNIKANLKSTHTTIMGIIAGLLLLLPQIQNLLDGDPATQFSEVVLLQALALMGLGIVAKQGDKKSEDVGL